MTAPTTTSDTAGQLRRALASLKDLRGRLEDVERARHEPIAIVGMACRFPGADHPDAYWTLLRDGVDAITETPADRWDAESLYDADPEAAGRVAIRTGGFLDGIDQFDGAYFGIAPREAAQMDPQQRLLLEVASEALEDGGQAADELAGTNTGVFVGVHSHSADYYLLQAADPRHLDLYSGTGTSHSVVSGRLSYLLDLRGPSLAVDTACSSSLVAAHLAVQSLRAGECDLALVAGVNVIIDPTFTIVASRMRMMSERGRCQPFDARADGFVRSEGCGAVVLKRLSDAVAAGDRVLAAIEGSAVNQDGRSNGLTAPNSLSQQAVIRAALADAGIEPGAVGLIEAHGTGTPLGDPIEVEALGAVFGGDEARPSSCALGSAKANVGHLEGAAGMAGLIKAVLTLVHGEVPPLLHFQELNPHVSLVGTPLVIPTARRPWPATATPRHAGVSSFGWSGTNAHLVVGEAPAVIAVPVTDDDGPHLLPISARSEGALRDLAGAYAALVATGTAPLRDVCATASLRRSHHPHRLAAVGRTGPELHAALDAFVADHESRGLATGGPGGRGPGLVAFVFPGQGGQWPGMGRQLLAAEPVFRAAIERCDEAMAPHVSWSLPEILTGATSVLDDIDVVQPALFGIQIGLAALWQAWGVVPDAVVGHSMGEVAAAHVAGILGLEDAARIICRRSVLLRRIRGMGAMAVVDLPVDEARQAIAGHEDRLAIAVSNSPDSTVLSGDPTAIDEVMAKLSAADVFCRRVKVDVASHSPQVDVLYDDLVEMLDGICPRPATVPFLSTVTARYEAGPDLDAEYWARNLRQPVQFAAATRRLLDDHHGRFVELSPHPVLLTAIDETARHAGQVASTFAPCYRDADESVSVRHALGSLYADGYDVDWRAVHGSEHRPVALPSYPWQHERYWIETTPAAAAHHGRRVHPLLGWEQQVADTSTMRLWENTLEARDLAYRPELDADGARLLPTAALFDLLVAAADALGHPSIADVRIDEPMVLADEPVTVQTVFDPGRAGGTLGVFSGGDDGWIRRAHARLGPALLVPEVVTDPCAGVPVEGSLMEACVHATSANDSLRAVGAAAVHVHREPSERMHCVVTAAPDAIIADVRVVDAEGRAVVTVIGLERHPVDRAGERVDGWSYRIEWCPQAMTAPARPATGNWLVLGDGGGMGDALAAALAADGARVTVVPPGADAAAIVGAGTDELGVVYLRGLDAPSIGGATAADIERAEGDACGGLLAVVAGLVRAGRQARIHVVTCGAQPVGPAPGVLQAPLCGLARSLAEEMPDLWGRSIDLDPRTRRADAVGALAHELAAGDDEGEVVYRDGERFVARLVRQPLVTAAPVRLRPDASYLVTGGFGGLGREVARWLVDQGARRLVLMGRTTLPPRAAWAGLAPDSPEGSRVALVRQLEGAGAAVHVASLDVGDESALRAFLEHYEAEGYPPIRGVVHTAAVFERRLLGDLDGAELWAQLRPKVVGAWLLSELLGPLDHFVLFSSIAAVLPQPGQGAYVAGNAFLDALAHWRVGRGQAALSVNWGIWAGSGRGLLGEEWRRPIEQMEAQGFRDFRIDQGLDALGRMLRQPAPQLVFTPVDWERYAAMRPTSALVAGLVAEQRRDAPRPAAPSSLRERLGTAAAEDRPDIAETTVRQVAARVLHLPERQIDVRQPLGELGLDSLMGIELRNRLEAEVGTKLSATLAWNHPAVADLAAYLLDKLGYADHAAIDEPAGGDEPSPFTELLVATDELGDDEIIEALMRGAQQ